MKIKTIVITPEMARELLTNNTANRPIKPNHIIFLMKEIVSGNWKFNGDPIRIGHDGSLIDGQHRLTAVIRTGIAIETLLIDGLDPKVFDTIDSGARRSTGDTLSVFGEKNGRNLAAALVVVNDLIMGKNDFHHTVKISNSEILDMLNKYSGIRESLYWGRAIDKLAPFSVSVALHYLFSLKNKDKANTFFEAIHTGVNINNNDPTYWLRRRMIENATSKSKMTRRYMAALFIKAWNAHTTSKKMRSLKFCETGDGAEPFPNIE
jgi:hypothetical protein